MIADNTSECSSIDLKSLQSDADSHTTLFPIKSYYDEPETSNQLDKVVSRLVKNSTMTTDHHSKVSTSISFGAHYHMTKLSSSAQSCPNLEILGAPPSLSQVPLKSPFPQKKTIVYSSSLKMIPKTDNALSPDEATSPIKNSFAAIHRERLHAMNASCPAPVSQDPARESLITKRTALVCTRKLHKYKYGVSPLERIHVLQRDLDNVAASVASGKKTRLSTRTETSRPTSSNYEFRPFATDEKKVPIITEFSRGSITIPSVSAATEDEIMLHSARLGLSRSENNAHDKLPSVSHDDHTDNNVSPALLVSPKSNRPGTHSAKSKRREISSPTRSNIVQVGQIAYTSSALQPNPSHSYFVLESDVGDEVRRDVVSYHDKQRMMAMVGDYADIKVPDKCNQVAAADPTADPTSRAVDVQIFARKTESTLSNDSEAADVLMTTLNTLHVEDQADAVADRLLRMESRYINGKSQVTIRSTYSSNGQPQRIPEDIRMASENPLSMNSLMRAPPICVQCVAEKASVWCLECQYSYCRRCWNTIPHHKYITPDELWNTRQPLHSIEKCTPVDPPVHVYVDSKGDIKQGVLNRKKMPQSALGHHPSAAFRTLAPMKNSTNAQTWANLNDSRSFTPDGFGHPKSAAERSMEAERNRLKSPLKSPFKARRETKENVEGKSRRKSRKDELVEGSNKAKRKIPIFQASGSGVALTRSMQPRRDAKPMKGIIHTVSPVEVDNSNGMKRREIEVHKGKSVYVKPRSQREQRQISSVSWDENEADDVGDGIDEDLKDVSTPSPYNLFTDSVTEDPALTEDLDSSQ